MTRSWLNIRFEPWRETCAALHLYTQVVAKYRLTRAPWINHSWHATLYVNADGLTTSTVPDGSGGIEIELDLLDHKVTSDGRCASFALADMSVADFHSNFVGLVAEIGVTPEFHGEPNEIADAQPFCDDLNARPYEADAVTRFFHACVQVDRAFKQFRTGFLGNVSPVHLFWGSFDLAVTRFSGRVALLRPRGVPAVPDNVTYDPIHTRSPPRDSGQAGWRRAFSRRATIIRMRNGES